MISLTHNGLPSMAALEATARELELRAAAGGDDRLVNDIFNAGQMLMEAAQKARTKKDRSILTRKCNELITLAERYKLAAANPDPPGPKSTRKLSTAEKVILLRSSKLHGSTFLPWEGPPAAETFAKGPDGELFTDSATYTFSPSQQQILAGWKRPLELGLKHTSDQMSHDSLMRSTSDSDLIQDMVTDCSVVASLTAAMRHLCPGQHTLLRSLMYPFDQEALIPVLSESGKLPQSSDPQRTLFVVDRKNPRLIWPALMEKAYLKIRGGYDFPGSNSGTDLYVLTGWIPEQVFLHHEDLSLRETWSMVKDNLDKGHLMATLGTPHLSAEEEVTLGLVSEHDYAVIDLKEEEGVPLLLVKNPWRNSVVWKGLGSSTYIESNSRAPGTFWIPFDDVVQHFAYLYLNWNPALFSHRQDHHFAWDIPERTVATSDLTHNPQYTLMSTSASPVWILLSRHWQDGELDMLRDNPVSVDDQGPHHQTAARSLASVSGELGFMGLRVYSNTSPPGSRLLVSDRPPLHSGPLVDSSQTLLRIEEPIPNKPYTVVVAQSDLPLPKYSFTFSILSHSPVTFYPSPEPFLYSQSISSSWTRRSSGGNPSSGTYYLNPTWSVTIPQPTALSLLLTTSSLETPVNVHLLHPSPSASRGVSAPTNKDIIFAGSEYTRAAVHATSRVEVPTGTYHIVASTYTPGQLADLVLRIDSNVPVTLTRIPSPDAGRFRTSLPLLSLSAQEGTYRLPVSITRVTRLYMVADCLRGGTCRIRLSLCLGTGPRRRVLTVVPSREEDFTSVSATGNGQVRTEDLELYPETVKREGGLWVLVESAGGGADRFQVSVEALSDNRIEKGVWEAWDDSGASGKWIPCS
ncbi:cysteine protease [Coniochaeta pulveracea]|uniref:Cysteine protease n=1 Tax=Coniochaeta pulveracea TaxID=177199 RepID=A0A420YJ58_9PEZI|nr:cysteine protease [Coniochaeta pulveracea]